MPHYRIRPNVSPYRDQQKKYDPDVPPVADRIQAALLTLGHRIGRPLVADGDCYISCEPPINRRRLERRVGHELKIKSYGPCRPGFDSYPEPPQSLQRPLLVASEER